MGPWHHRAVRTAENGRFLVLLGSLAWLFAGVPRVFSMLEARAEGDLAWLALYLGFGACMTAALSSRSARAALALTIAQSAIAIAILGVGMPHFEGALLALVGAQVRLVVPLRIGLAWIALQSIPLAIAIAASHGALGTAKASLEYVAFSAFAALLFDLRHAERERRLELAAIHAELLGTRALLTETAKLAEQRRIGRDLHDVVGHHLVAIAMHLERAHADPAALDRAREALSAVQADVRGLLAGEQTTLDLEGALGALAGATPAMRVRIDASDAGEIEPDRAWAIFRCVQEGLTNAWKHGRAREVRVIIRANDRSTTVRIENDGAHPRAEPAQGRGLRGMRERLEALGGQLAIDSRGPFALVLTLPRSAR